MVDRFVVVNLQDPPERFVGRLLDVGSAGIVIRGLDLGAFDSWINDLVKREENGVCPSTVFFPLHRVEKVILDEDLGGIPSLANTFRDRVGVPVDKHLE